MRTIQVRLNVASVESALQQLTDYRKSLAYKGKEICKRLANYGELLVSEGYATAPYDGDKDYEVTVEEIPNGFRILADGMTVLILEFGAGAALGYGHPQADKFGMGPGTYPEGKGHWNEKDKHGNYKGWWIPKWNGGGHTYGNPPSKSMFYASKAIRDEVERVAREVFRS